MLYMHNINTTRENQSVRKLNHHTRTTDDGVGYTLYNIVIIIIINHEQRRRSGGEMKGFRRRPATRRWRRHDVYNILLYNIMYMY